MEWVKTIGNGFGTADLVLLCVAGAVYLLPVRIKKPHWIGRVIMLVVGAFEVCFLMIGAT